MNDKIESIRQACILANPEIVELKFGCLVAFHHRLENPIYVQHVYQDEKPRMVEVTVFPGQFSEDVFKVIGRPIRLADVLLAIMIAKNEKRSTGTYFPGYITIVRELIILWNLLKDDLTLQSEDTIDFIHNLLKS